MTGNIGSDAEKALLPTVESLKTPTIKTEHFTTGRGGTGNMAYNHPAVPEMARASQDVGAPAIKRRESETGQGIRHGRGGAANISRPDQNVVVTKDETRGRDQSGRRLSQGWADKGRGLLDSLRSKSKSKSRAGGTEAR